jgi:serine/threonine-protein kinase
MLGHLVDGKYQVLRLIGQGGMGAVYEGIHTGTGRRVAIKLISATLENNVDMVRRFHREARAAGAIDTQHIVQVLDTGIDGMLGYPFMVMEFLTGQDLSQLIRKIGPLPPDLALRTVAQACFGLERAHQAGVVHRDIKPANLFLARREAGEVIVKVLDFGIAKMKVEETATAVHGLTKTGAMLGSPSYMSPEQAKGLKTIDHRSDIWSMGAVLYEALTGRTPHHQIETLGQLIIAICAEPPRPVQDFAPWVPPEVAAIAHGALVLDPESRFQSAAAMLSAMMPLLAQGIAMNEVMLAPMPKEYRTLVQPRLQITATGAPVVSTTNRSGRASIPDTAKARRVAVAVTLSTAALASLAGFGVWRMMARSADAQPSPSAIAPESPASATAIDTAAAASAPSAAVSPATDARKVRVPIVPPLPTAAVVTVDGKSVETIEGAVELEGVPGSEKIVKVTGGPELTQRVILTLSGSDPPQITWARAAAPHSPKAASPTPPPPATAVPTTHAQDAKKGPANAARVDPDLQ